MNSFCCKGYSRLECWRPWIEHSRGENNQSNCWCKVKKKGNKRVTLDFLSNFVAYFWACSFHLVHILFRLFSWELEMGLGTTWRSSTTRFQHEISIIFRFHSNLSMIWISWIQSYTFSNNYAQFVNFTEIMSKNIATAEKEAAFALAALMEVPFQYKAVTEMNLIGLGLTRLILPLSLHESFQNCFSEVGWSN